MTVRWTVGGVVVVSRWLDGGFKRVDGGFKQAGWWFQGGWMVVQWSGGSRLDFDWLPLTQETNSVAWTDIA